MKIKSTLLVLIVLLISCENKKEKKDATLNQEMPYYQNKSFVQQDTLQELLMLAKTKDTLEFSSQEPFLFMKSGNLFSNNVKNSILVYCPSETTYKIELYTLFESEWKKTDEISKLEVPLQQYEIIFEDYNFDNFKDIYLNAASSNGISMSEGYLLIVDTLTQKFVNHLETRSLKNMFPDKKTKTILIDSIDYQSSGKIVWNLIYKWENGKLINTNKKIKTDQVY